MIYFVRKPLERGHEFCLAGARIELAYRDIPILIRGCEQTTPKRDLRVTFRRDRSLEGGKVKVERHIYPYERATVPKK